jgi:uncharacterized membrane-anchored protein
MSEVTKNDLVWRKKFHALTGHLDMDFNLAKLIARHRIASANALQAELAEARAERDGARKAMDYLLSDPEMPSGVLDRVRLKMQRYGHEAARQALAGKETP